MSTRDKRLNPTTHIERLADGVDIDPETSGHVKAALGDDILRITEREEAYEYIQDLKLTIINKDLHNKENGLLLYDFVSQFGNLYKEA